MKINRTHISIVTDTGANFTTLTPPIHGHLRQVHYLRSADTGVRLDTGAELKVTADTGLASRVLLDTHLQPGTFTRQFRIPVHDTGGDASLYAAGGEPVEAVPVIAGERLTVTVQGAATDTGKVGDVFLYTE